MTMQAVWTIEVGGSSRKYSNMNFERKLDRKTPTTFKAKIEYASPAVAFFDLVEIKRNGTTEWKGYVEAIEVEWDDSGRWYNVSGRDTTVILWKKYGEEFQQYADGIEGFFGKVSASELIKFILRTPRSDLPSESANYKYNKMGWGLDSSRITDVTAARTAYGDPKWTILRKRSVAGWRNVGTPYTSATKTVTSALSTTNWTTVGASPYINTDDDDTSYIKSGATVDAEAIFQLDNLAGATGINAVHLSVHWKADSTWWWWINSECEVWVSRDAGASWAFAFNFGGRNTGWLTYTADVSDYFNKVSYLSGGNARIKFVNKSGSLSTFVTYAYLAINYSTGGTQDVTDYFQATINTEDVVGIYVESRADEESYPRNYDVVYVTDTIENYSTFSETDPNNHITLEDSDTDVNFDSYQNEDAYLYKDYGVNAINAFDWKFAFKITTPQNHPRCFVPFVVSNALNDLKYLENTGAEYFTALYVTDSSGSLTIAVENQDAGGLGTSTGHAIVAGTTYYLRVIRAGTLLKYMCYSDADLSDAHLLWTETFTLSSSALRYRYRMQACTYNGLEWATQFINDMSDGFSEWARHGETATVTFPDIGGSELLPPSGKVMQVVADAGEYGYVEEDVDGFEETKTDFYVKVPAPSSEAIDTSLPVNSWHFVNNDWTHVGDSPWLHDDEASNYITMAIGAAYLGLYDEYYDFDQLHSKYRQISISALELHIKAGQGSHTGEGANATVHAYLKWIGQDTWVYAGTLTYDSDVYTDKSLDISGLGINTINKINTLKVKLAFGGFGGNEDGHFDITYVYTHVEGTGYMGSIRLAKVYDHDVTAGPNPATDFCAGVLVDLDSDSSTNQDKWRWKVDGFANGGVWNSDMCDSEFPTAATWYKLRLYTKKASDGSGYFKLYKVEALVETLLCEYTGLTNNNYGDPDRVCIEAVFDSYNSGTAQLDYVVFSSLGITHTTGYVYSFEPVEVVLASVTGNTYRDIIHSWSPVNIGNIKIKITDVDAHAWVVTQLYIYKAESTDYRIMHEDASTPSFALNQYIHAITVDDTYSTPVGPVNVTESRVIDQINSIMALLNTAYVPYEWYLELVTNNTFHICDAKGSDKSGTISFVLGDNLEKSTREQTLEDTFQRLKIKGKGESSRSEESSSGWINDTSAMTTAKTFVEEIRSQKEVVTSDTAEILANVELTENADPKDKIECDVSRDEYASMAYDVGDSVLLTDSLIDVNSAKRLYNIRKSIDDNGEHVTLNLGAPYKDVEATWQEIFSRLKSLEIGGGITGDWTDQVKGAKISASKMTTLFEKTAKGEEVSTGNDSTDPKWKKTNVGSNGTSFELGDNGVALKGCTSGSAQVIMTVDYYYDIAVTTEEGTSGNDIQYLLTPKMNPKIEFEFNPYEQTTGSPTYWRSGDNFDVGVAKKTAGYITGAWFRFLSIGSSSMEIFAVWRDVGDATETARFMTTVSCGVKYRFIIQYDYERQLITWEIWDIANKAKYPLVAVRSNMSVSDTNSVHPLFMELTSYNESGFRAQALLYHVKIEYERVTEEIGEAE